MIGSRWSLLIAMGIPAIAVLVGIPVISQSNATIFGMPVIFGWLFAWLPLTTLCMWVSWRYLEREEYRRLEGEEE